MFAQEISDFNKRTILPNNNVDGEVSVHKLILEAQCDTPDHVLCMTADHVNVGQFLSISPPFVNLVPLLFLSKETEFYINTVEVPLQSASGALYNNYAPLQNDVDSLIAENGLHPCSRSGKEPSFSSLIHLSYCGQRGIFGTLKCNYLHNNCPLD